MSSTPIVAEAALVDAVTGGGSGALRELCERRDAWLCPWLRRCNDPEVLFVAGSAALASRRLGASPGSVLGPVVAGALRPGVGP